MRLAARWTDTYPVAHFWSNGLDMLELPEVQPVYITLVIRSSILALRLRHEQSVIDAFFDRFKEAASNNGSQLFRCSLDGQDISTGADYLITESTWFAMVEFKYQERQIADENTKPRRLALCKALDTEVFRLSQHVSCHFIGWSTPNPRTVLLNIYRNEVCHQALWPSQSGLLLAKPETKTRIEADKFMVNFFKLDDSAGSSFEDFDNYLTWLLGMGGGNGSTDIELLLYNPGDSQCLIHDFSSLAALKTWLDNNRSGPTTSPSFEPSP